VGEVELACLSAADAGRPLPDTMALADQNVLFRSELV
jgi:hypothetical protein